DFGYPGIALMLETTGQDMTCFKSGYNWFGGDFADRKYDSYESWILWNQFYNQIYAANNVLSATSENPSSALEKAYRGQALAFRAFNYLHLAQMYQFTYIGHENDPCVPILTEKTTMDEAVNNPRASVKTVYGLIMSDLNLAISYLKGFIPASKGFISQGAAYGLRARANLLMQDWEQAASDADSALIVSGAVPYTKKEVSVPSFNTANANSVIWANIIRETNEVVTSGIVNWPGHFCSFTGNGYVNVGAFKSINKPLYDAIPTSDVRKGWWLNENKQSPLVADKKYDKWKETYAEDENFTPYINVKFGAYKDLPMNTVNSQDWILMRAEEMTLIKAEALAMSGDPGQGKAVLEGFVKENRDATFTVTDATDVGVQNAVWKQRRIELWGEGFAYFDVLRLKKPLNRVENGVSSFPDAWQYNIPAESPILLWRISSKEINANAGISESQNNPVADVPKKGDGL
ncbi:MAG: RagB/SusD family nutrient uptake outer membrane protein, partial [Paludibacter sp.]|nr:RagB/SusD family nutrient uptake outer membrane protein [Paludibacter sp.]